MPRSKPEDHGSRKPARAHSPGGAFIRTVEQAQFDMEAARLRSRAMSYQAIADELGVAIGTAHAMVKRALASIPREAAETLVGVESAKLDNAERAVLAVLEARHFTVSNGKLIYIGDEPLYDDGPVLNAVDRLVKISESRRKLFGADAPARSEVTVVDPTDQAIAELAERMRQRADAAPVT